MKLQEPRPSTYADLFTVLEKLRADAQAVQDKIDEINERIAAIELVMGMVQENEQRSPQPIEPTEPGPWIEPMSTTR